MEAPVHARLLNGGGELIAEGPCRVDEATGTALLEPEREAGLLRRERGDMALELETGRSLRVSERPIVFRLRPAPGSGQHQRRTMYRLHIVRQAAAVEGAQDARAVGGAGEGAPAPPERETPAAR